jgi:hypothetical protein
MRVHRAISTTVLATLALTLTRCDSLESPLSEENRLVVESYHEVGRPLGNVRFTRAADLDGAYSADDQGISGANVKVFLLAADGSREREFQFREIPSQPGIYEPIPTDPMLELRSYALQIEHPDIPEVITGTTFSPGSFEIVRPGAEEVVYQQDPQFQMGVTRSTFPDRQTILMFSVESLDPAVDNMTPLYFDLLDVEDDLENGKPEEEILRDIRIIESDPVNEANYDVLPDDTIVIKLPWFAIGFFGPHTISASAIDDNLYDFFRSQSVQQGGSTLSPGEIPNLITRLSGATGIFGAYSRVSQDTFIAE